jgi:hypothetical protein
MILLLLTQILLLPTQIIAEYVAIAGRLCLLHTDIDAAMDAEVPS